MSTEAVTRGALEALYADGDDPWRFRTSAYEAAKRDATLAALARPRYAAILEIGCGNGELGRRLAARAARYDGVDAVERALAAARRAVPAGRFHRRYLPAPLPDGPFDLIVLSEVLYFLDPDGLRWLAATLAARWARAEIVAVNWLGPSGNALSGAEALALFVAALPPGRAVTPIAVRPRYRIDRIAPEPDTGDPPR